MSALDKKIRVVVSSRRIATGVISYDMPAAGLFGRMYNTTKQTTVYERVLDDDQKAMLAEAQSFSAASGIKLEVIDVGKKNLISRILWYLTREFENPPSLVFSGNISLRLLLPERRRNRGQLV